MIHQPDYAAILAAANRQQFADVLPREQCKVLEFGPSTKAGPRECCAEWASVVACDGERDDWECWVCGNRWQAPCR